MLLFELLEAVFKDITGQHRVYTPRKRDEIYEPRVMDPDDLRRIQESDENILYSNSGDPADRVRDWEAESNRTRVVGDDEDFCGEERRADNGRGIDPVDRIESWEGEKEYENRERAKIVSDHSDSSEPQDVQTTLSDFCDTGVHGNDSGQSYWVACCEAAAERMSGDCDSGGDSDGGTGGDAE